MNSGSIPTLNENDTLLYRIWSTSSDKVQLEFIENVNNPYISGGGAGINASHNANGQPGNAGSISEGGAPGNGGNNDGEAVAAPGGGGGEASAAAGSGGTGQGGEGSTYSGAGAGAAGAAIRRNTGFTVNVNIASSGSVNGVQNATTVL